MPVSPQQLRSGGEGWRGPGQRGIPGCCGRKDKTKSLTAGETPKDPTNRFSSPVNCREGPGKTTKGLNPGGSRHTANHSAKKHLVSTSDVPGTPRSPGRSGVGRMEPWQSPHPPPPVAGVTSILSPSLLPLLLSPLLPSLKNLLFGPARVNGTEEALKAT